MITCGAKRARVSLAFVVAAVFASQEDPTLAGTDPNPNVNPDPPEALELSLRQGKGVMAFSYIKMRSFETLLQGAVEDPCTAHLT